MHPLADLLGPIVLTACLTTFGTWIITGRSYRLSLMKDKQLANEERGRHARYLAVRVVCALDPFAIGCADVAADGGEEDGEGISRPSVDKPDLLLPADVDWKSIPADLLYCILSLPNDIESAEKSTSFVGSEIASPPDYDEYFAERQFQFARLGLVALDLADELRSAYGLPNRSSAKWDPREQLEKAIADAKKAADEAAASIADDILNAAIAKPS